MYVCVVSSNHVNNGAHLKGEIHLLSSTSVNRSNDSQVETL